MKLGTVQNILSNGVPFAVRIVEKGQPYGLNMMLTHDEDRPMIEFYDARYRFDRLDGIILGQFVTRYNLDTFMENGGPKNGLCLYGGVPSWTLDRAACDQIHSLLRMWGL